MKIASVGILAGLVVGAITLSTKAMELSKTTQAVAGTGKTYQDNTMTLAQNLFLQNVFGFEALGVLLLVIAVGTVALSRSRGGTHARD